MENNNKIQSVVSNPDRELIQLTYIYKISRIHRQTSVQLSHYSGAYIRLYIPVNPPTETKLPLIIYLHGGDFVLFSASTVIFHDFCNNIATQFPAVVASVEYRLAPENQLPEAYEDALNAIFWVQSQAQGSPRCCFERGVKPRRRRVVDITAILRGKPILNHVRAVRRKGCVSESSPSPHGGRGALPSEGGSPSDLLFLAGGGIYC
ncbi:putative carboxylesterase 8-like [Forsythia ovata]|uniref:Carboxylesterase 8-like n=1 Tax=Forsythia ovata TaxID=205694 RepID=A0ABD1Q9P7_9LAMI